MSESRPRGMRARYRIPLKVAILAGVVLAVSYPDPRILFRHLGRVRDMDRMIDPGAPQLAPFEAELRTRLERAIEAQRIAAADARRRESPSREANTPGDSAPLADADRGHEPDAVGEVEIDASKDGDGAAETAHRLSARETLKIVEKFVYEKVPYDWDWNTWGVADYMPTVAEMFESAGKYPDGQIREDCDGRAVMAASLLRRLGYEAQLLTDFGHVWVRAKDPSGRDKASSRPVELMGPGHARAVVSTASGNQFRFDWTVLKALPRALSLGLSVFPFRREAIVFVTLMILLSCRGMSRRAAIVGVALALAGWQFMRVRIEYWDDGYLAATGHFWLGVSYLLAGCLTMYIAGRRARSRRT
jgi:hypothetical protein